MSDSFEVRTAEELDPLLCRVDMPYKVNYYPLGFPLEIATNSEEVLAAAQESWSRFDQAFFVPPARLRIATVEAINHGLAPVPVFRSQQHLLVTVSGVGDFSCCDMNQGFGFAYLTTETVSNHAYVRYYYLESMAYSILQALYLTPIHAACVALNGQGLLLCGDSGAGKSSLAYACARRGWTYISDDASYLIRKSANTNVVVGNPHLIRLRESAPMLFPELSDQKIVLRGHGDKAIELATAKAPGISTAAQSKITHIIFLRRDRNARPSLSDFPKERALRRFERVVCMGDDRLKAAQMASLRQLLSSEILEFRYSDMDPAVEELSSFARSFGPPRRASQLVVRQANG